jgi:hypothetical protein
VDEVVGLIVEQLARRAREAKQRAATASPGQAATPGAPAPPSSAVPKSRAASGNRGPNATRARAATQPVAPTPPAFDGGLGALPSLDAADPFGGVGSAVAPVESASGASVATPLLADFTGGNAFLRAFVVSEALALPVALREPKLP